MKFTAILTLLLLFLVSCKKEKQSTLCAEPTYNTTCVTDSASLTTLILGKWDWSRRMVWGFTESVQTPCTENYDYSYEFFADGTVKHYKNGIFNQGMFYRFSNESGVQMVIEDSATHQNQPQGGTGMWVSICGDYLMLDTSPVDGPKLTFRRSE